MAGNQQQPQFHCPTFLESFLATCALWPRGRAWPVSDGVTPSSFYSWISRLVGLPKSWPTGFVQAGYSAAIALVRNYIETRLCALRNEFWCATINETRDQWMIEYGLPDDCDPFPDLCTKVAALGGTRCDYYAAIAARAGWSISCNIIVNNCGDGIGCLEIGCGQLGPLSTGTALVITVFLNESAAYVAPLEVLPYMGNFQIGGGLDCAPDLAPLQCLLERVVHAHVILEYTTVDSVAGVVDLNDPDQSGLIALL